MNDKDREEMAKIFPDSEYNKPDYQKTFEEFFSDKKDDELYLSPEPFEKESLPRSILWGDFNKEVFPKQSWRINDLIPSEGFVILASISGNRKTWVAMEMAKSIASGNNFLGEEMFSTEACNVMYINGENAASEMQRRGKQLGLGEEEGQYKIHLCNADNINLNTTEGAVWLKAYVEFYKIKVVFIDTFIATVGGLKEDKSDEVRQFFNKFSSLKNKGVAVVWLMHLRKPTNFEGKAPKKEQVLGSQDKAASVEVLLMLQSEAGSDKINLYQRKNRLGVEIPAFKISMKDTIDGEGNKKTIIGYDGEIEESSVSKIEQAKELILGILENEGKTTNQVLELTKKLVGQKNTRFALRALLDEKLIDSTREGKQNYYFIQPEVVLDKAEIPPEENGLDFF